MSAIFGHVYNLNIFTLILIIDPLASSPQKALEAIGNNLQKQYERWQPRVRINPGGNNPWDGVWASIWFETMSCHQLCGYLFSRI